jgi:hypothetical protein
MRHRDLASSFHRIVLATLATSAAGCGGIDTSGYELPACASGDYRPDYASGLAPSEPYDHIELRRREGLSESAFIEVVQSAGEPCSGASDREACLTELAALAPTVGFRIGQCVQVCDEYVFVLTRGDSIEVVDSVEATLALLGPIDTPTEAVLRAGMAEYYVSCDDPERGGVRTAGDAYEVLATRLTADCDPVETTLYRLGVSSSADVTELESEVIESESGVCIGRRPSCLVRRRARGATPLGAYFASVAHLESAAAIAFGELARELAHHGAPAELVTRARRSEADERRHAIAMRALARRYGGRPVRARSAVRAPRSLEAIALHNASEGCVRESFGALVGLWQAHSARDPRVRGIMQRVAREELRHAELSLDLDRWARAKLGRRFAAKLDDARRDARQVLERELDEAFDPSLVAEAGLPTPTQHRALFDAFVRTSA